MFPSAIPNPCDTSPCLNGATCTRNIPFCASYTCECPVGFEGDNCEQSETLSYHITHFFFLLNFFLFLRGGQLMESECSCILVYTFMTTFLVILCHSNEWGVDAIQLAHIHVCLLHCTLVLPAICVFLLTECGAWSYVQKKVSHRRKYESKSQCCYLEL